MAELEQSEVHERNMININAEIASETNKITIWLLQTEIGVFAKQMERIVDPPSLTRFASKWVSFIRSKNEWANDEERCWLDMLKTNKVLSKDTNKVINSEIYDVWCLWCIVEKKSPPILMSETSSIFTERFNFSRFLVSCWKHLRWSFERCCVSKSNQEQRDDLQVYHGRSLHSLRHLGIFVLLRSTSNPKKKNKKKKKLR